MTKLLTRFLAFAWAAAFLFGLFTVGMRFLTGKEIAAYGGYVPWGLWVAVYIYFVGIAAGSFLLSTLVFAFRVRALEPIGKLAIYVSVVTLVGGLVTIFMDLGQPFRAWKVIANPNPTSMMAWMIWMYSAFALLALAILRLLSRAELVAAAERGGLLGRLAGLLAGHDRDLGVARCDRDALWVRRLAFVGIPLTVAFSGGVGALFGVIGARPFWNASIFPLIFLGGAVLTGTALVTCLYALFAPDRGSERHREVVTHMARLTLALLVVDILLEWAEFSISYYASIPSHAVPWKMILFGDFWWVFWIVHLALGILVPLALLATGRGRRSIGRVASATFLVAFTFLSVRLNIVIPGLVREELEGLENAYRDFRLNFDYFPSVWEFGVTLFSYALVALLLYLGTRYLPLFGERSTLAKELDR
jgi:molybdopterin-containing oxidoreductase family membrane subunit